MAITDNFNRANSADLGANWTPVTGEGAAQIVSNAVVTGAIATDSVERYSGVSWNADQSSSIKLSSGLTGALGAGVITRAAAAAQTYYFCYTDIGSNQTVNLRKRLSGTGTTIATTTASVAANDVLSLEVSGSNLTVRLNGTIIIGPVADTDILSGSPGILVFVDSGAVGDMVIDDWTGTGEVASGLTPSPSQGPMEIVGTSNIMGFKIGMPSEL